MSRSRKETHQPGEKDDDDDKPGAPRALEFHATYTINCEAPESVTGMETVYFTNFAGAQLLNVNVTTAKGQNAGADDAAPSRRSISRA